MDTAAYLARITYSGPTEPTIDTLRALHRAHLYSVPFENLDIGLRRAIDLSDTALFDKIVTRRRGGFCYELNGLFGQLLQALGFQVTLLSAASANDDGSYGQEYDHLLLEITTPDAPNTPWLADVGWGNGPLEPLRLDEIEIQTQGERQFRITTDGAYYILWEDYAEAGEAPRWVRHYRFTRIPRRYDEFFGMCHYHQTSPDSMFTQKRLCTLFTRDGRVTVSDLRMIVTANGTRTERDLTGEDELRRVLVESFGVVLP